MSANRADYFDRVHEVVAQIPFGKVTSYGAIAQFLGLKSGARMVGWACNTGTSDPFSPLPFHRVVNRIGMLSGRHHFPGDVMRERLVDEEIEFVDEFQVNMKKHFWDPMEHLERM
ncbi:6-O-methylguanine DNA methyltransferase [bacterium]|nr:MAG: 6-O-methylguanine DNA methyltransferase [bacterium]